MRKKEVSAFSEIVNQTDDTWSVLKEQWGRVVKM